MNQISLWPSKWSFLLDEHEKVILTDCLWTKGRDVAQLVERRGRRATDVGSTRRSGDHRFFSQGQLSVQTLLQ